MSKVIFLSTTPASVVDSVGGKLRTSLQATRFDTYAYVQRQPQDEAEKIAVQIILDTCPVQAIGKVLTAGAEYSRN